MTQSINKPVFDFSTTPEEQVKQLEASLKKDAPAVAKAKQGLVPAPKAAKTSPAKKSGRVVGISADENKMLQNLLQTVQEDANYSIISSTEAFAKLQARYNK